MSNDEKLEEMTRTLYRLHESRKLAVEEADLMQCQMLDGQIATYENEIKRLVAEGGFALRVEVSGQGHVGTQE